jgi:hypothetical protein
MEKRSSYPLGKKNASTEKRSSYPSTLTVMDIFHDIHLPVDKTSTVTARGSAVVSGPAVSTKKISKYKISFLPTDPIFVGHVIGNQQFIIFCLMLAPTGMKRVENSLTKINRW